MASLTPDEKRCCDVLSYLFLNTEFTEFDMVVKNLSEVQMPLEDIRHLLYYDIFYALSPNIAALEGAWFVFEDEFVYERVEAYRASPSWISKPLLCLKWALFSWIVTPYWIKIEERYLGASKRRS